MTVCAKENCKRTSDSLNEGLSIKWQDKSSIENDNFILVKVVGSSLELSVKMLFILNKYRFKNNLG